MTVPPPAPGCGSCAARDAVVAAQAEAVSELRQKVARLERLVSRSSGSSSMPPSGGDVPGRTPPRRQRRAGRAAGRRRGRQPGSPGTAMSWAEPDEVRDHHPAGACGCGADLADAEDLGVARSYQQLETPEPAAQRIQHDLHQARCACGREHVAARPPGVSDSAVSIGPSLRALAGDLIVFQHVPVERCRQLLSDVTGAEVSAGFIHSCLARAADAIAGVVRLIRTLITAAHVAGFDETALRSGPAGKKKYVHGASTELYAAFLLGARGLETMRELGTLPGFGGVIVSDRYQSYLHDGWQHIAGNQACLAHIIRDYLDAAEPWPGALWPAQAQRAPRGLTKAWHQASDAGLGQIPARIRDPLASGLRHAVPAGLSDIPRIPGPRNTTGQHPGRDLLELCTNREDDVLRLTRDTRIRPTNNTSERGVRPLKTQQKTSGRLTRDKTTRDRLDIRGYLDTARKHRQDTLTVLRDAMNDTPWSPLAPAAAPP